MLLSFADMQENGWQKTVPMMTKKTKNCAAKSIGKARDVRGRRIMTEAVTLLQKESKQTVTNVVKDAQSLTCHVSRKKS